MRLGIQRTETKSAANTVPAAKIPVNGVAVSAAADDHSWNELTTGAVVAPRLNTVIGIG
jgi:hypothetical protein